MKTVPRAYARLAVEIEEDREDEQELDDLVEEVREEMLELIDRYRTRGYKLDLID